jgi:uncharacterized membrane protein
MAAPSQLARALGRGAPSGAPRGLAALLARPSTRTVLQLALLGEMVVDKLPLVPDRIEPGPLSGRALLGALAGGVLARVEGRSGALGGLLGGAGAVLAAHAGYHARRALTRRAGLPDLPVALCEDGLAVALARGALALSP